MNLSSQNITGIVLAGGQSRRLGRDKALEKIGDERILDRVIFSISSVCREIIIVGNDITRKNQLQLTDDTAFVTDLFPDKGSLGGLYSGLSASRTEWNFLFACDMPFISEAVLNFMIEAEIPAGTNVVAFEIDGYLQTIHALYRKSCLPNIEQNLLSGKLRMSGYFDDVSVSKMNEESIDSIPHGDLSFFNVNTSEDLEKAKSIHIDLTEGES